MPAHNRRSGARISRKLYARPTDTMLAIAKTSTERPEMRGRISGMGRPGAPDAAEAEVTGRRIDRLPLPCRGPIPEAVIRCAKVRSPFDDPTRHGLAGVAWTTGLVGG